MIAAPEAIPTNADKTATDKNNGNTEPSIHTPKIPTPKIVNKPDTSKISDNNTKSNQADTAGLDNQFSLLKEGQSRYWIPSKKRSIVVPDKEVEQLLHYFPNAQKASLYKVKNKNKNIFAVFPDKDSVQTRYYFPQAENIDLKNEVAPAPKSSDPTTMSRIQAFNWLTAIGKRDIGKAIDPSMENRLSDERSLQTAFSHDPTLIGTRINNTIDNITNERNNIFDGYHNSGRDYLDPEDKQLYDEKTAMIDRLKEVRDYLVGINTSDGHSADAINNSASFFKDTNPDYYNTWIKYAGKNGQIDDSKLTPAVKYSLEENGLVNNLLFLREKINDLSGLTNEVKADKEANPETSHLVDHALNSTEVGKKYNEYKKEYNDNLNLLNTIDSRYPKLTQQQAKDKAFQDKYDSWNIEHKALYNLWDGLVNGGIDIGYGVKKGVSSIFGRTKTKEELTRTDANHEQWLLDHGLDIPDRTGGLSDIHKSIGKHMEGEALSTLYGVSHMLPSLSMFALSGIAGETLEGIPELDILGEGDNAIALPSGIISSAPTALQSAVSLRNLPLLTTLTLQNYGNVYDAARENGHSNEASHLAAIGSTLAQYAIFGKGLPGEKISEAAFSNGVIAKALDKVNDMGLMDGLQDRSLIPTKVHAIAGIILRKAAQAKTGAMQGILLGAAAQMDKLTTEPANTPHNITWDKSADFTKQMTSNIISMALMGLIGKPSDIYNEGKNDFNSLTRTHSLYAAADNPLQFKGILDKKLSEGTINEDEYQKALHTLTDVSNIYNMTPEKDIKGKKLKERQRYKIFKNLLKKDAIKEREKKGVTLRSKERSAQQTEAVDNAIDKERGEDVKDIVYTHDGVGITKEEVKALPPDEVETNGKKGKKAEENKPEAEEKEIKPIEKNISYLPIISVSDDMFKSPTEDNKAKIAALTSTIKKGRIKRIITTEEINPESIKSIIGEGTEEQKIFYRNAPFLSSKGDYEDMEDFISRIKEGMNAEKRANTAFLVSEDVKKAMASLDKSNEDINEASASFKDPNFKPDKDYAIRFETKSKKEKQNNSNTKKQENAIQEQATTESVLRHEGLRGQSGLPQVEPANQPENTPQESEKEKKEVTASGGEYRELEPGLVVSFDKDGQIATIYNNEKPVNTDNPAYATIAARVVKLMNYSKSTEPVDIGNPKDEIEAIQRQIEISDNVPEIMEAYRSASDMLGNTLEKDASDEALTTGNTDPYVLALKYFADGGKIFKGEEQKIYGNKGGKKINKQSFADSNKLSDDKNQTIDKVAEDITSENTKSNPGWSEIGPDESKIKNALIDAFNAVSGKKDAMDKLSEAVNPNIKELRSIKDIAREKFNMLTGLNLSENGFDKMIETTKPIPKIPEGKTDEFNLFEPAKNLLPVKEQLPATPSTGDTPLVNPETIDATHTDISYGGTKKFMDYLKETIGKLKNLSFGKENPATIALTIPGIARRTVLDGFAEKGYVDFRGIKITSPADVADLFTIHRSPHIEKSHILYVKDGKIIGTAAETAGLPYATTIRKADDIISDMKKKGATEAWILHNHPSGNARPSDNDIKITRDTHDKLKSAGLTLAGSVVIDTDKFTYINPSDGKWTMQDYKNPPKKLFSTRIGMIGSLDNNATDIAKLTGDVLKGNPNTFAALYLDTKGNLIGYDVFGKDDINHLNDHLRNNYASNVMFATAEPIIYGRLRLSSFDALNSYAVYIYPKGNVEFARTGTFIHQAPREMLWSDIEGINIPEEAGKEAMITNPSMMMESLDELEKKKKDILAAGGKIQAAMFSMKPETAAEKMKGWKDNALKRMYQTVFRSSGVFGNDIRILKERATGEGNKIVDQGGVLSRKFKEGMDKFPLSDHKKIFGYINDYLETKGEGWQDKAMLGKVPESMRGTASAMKSLIKKWDKWLIDSDWLKQRVNYMIKNGEFARDEEGKPIQVHSMQQGFEKMLGKYLTNVYHIFLNKDFTFNDLAPNDQRRVQNLISESILQDNPKIAGDPDLLKLETSRKIEGIISDAKEGGRALRGYMHRENISEAYNLMLGKVEDTNVRFSQSMKAISSMVSNAFFSKEMMDNGLGKIMFKDATGQNVRFHKTIDFDTFGGKLFPLVGLKTDMPTYQALKAYVNGDWVTNAYRFLRDKDNVMSKIYNTAYGAMKGSVTVLNPHSQIRNFADRGLYAIAAGNFTGDAKTSFKTVHDQMVKGGDPDIEALKNELIENGILNHGVFYSTVQDMTKLLNENPATDEKTMIDKYAPTVKRIINSSVSGTRKGLQTASKIYGGSDDFWNVFNYLAEKKKYADAWFDKKPDELTKDENILVAAKAAELTKNMQPTYGRVYPFVKALNLNPILSNFLSYKAENFRNFWNIWETAFNEIGDENPKVKKIGYGRIGGMFAYMGAKRAFHAGMYALASNAVNTTQGGMLGTIFGGSTERRRMADLNSMVAPWFKNDDKVFYDEGNGVYMYRVPTYWDSFGDVTNSMQALINPHQDVGQIIGSFLGQTLGDAFSLSFPASLTNSLATGFKASGAPLWDENDALGDKFVAGLEYTLSMMEPGIINTVWKNWNDKHGTSVVGNELRGNLGLPNYYLDVNKTFSFRSHALIKEIRGYNYDIKADRAAERNNRRLTNALDKLRDLVGSSDRLGADENAMRKIIQYSGMTEEQKNDVFPY